MTKTVAIFFTIFIIFFTTSCLDGVKDNPNSRNPEMEMRELNEALAKLEDEGYDIDTTELGIFYIVHEEGEGPLAMAGDTLRLEYKGYTLGGMIFDASSYNHQDGIWEFVYKELELIPGFDDGLSVMNKGAVIDMIIPSEHAYGEAGSGLIDSYTTILFTAKLHDLKPGSE